MHSSSHGARPGAPTPLALAPAVDDDGLLRLHDRWVAITATQLPLVELLVANYGRVVRFPAVVDAYVAGGGSDRVESVRTVLCRLRTRLRPLGVELTTIRRRGVMLRPAPSDRRQQLTTV